MKTKIILPTDNECLRPCMGVERAFRKCMKIKNKNSFAVYKGIAHNKDLNQALKNKGMCFTNDLKKTKSKKVIIGAHGIQKKDLDYLKANKITYLDLTCPYVSLFLKKTQDYENKAYKIIIIGDPEHREIKNITSYLKNPVVIKDPEQAQNLNKISKAAIFTQTTELQKNIDKILSIIKKKCKQLVFQPTRCLTTEIRQSHAEKLSKKVDLMLVISDKASRNGRNLVKLCSKNTSTILIQNFREINPEYLKKNTKIGIVASASTPNYVVKEVIKTVSFQALS